MSEPTPGSESSTSGASTAGGQGHEHRAERHKDHKHPWLRRGGIAVVAALAVALVLGVVAYVKLTGNINRLDITEALGDRPKLQATTDAETNLAPVNILVMGSTPVRASATRSTAPTTRSTASPVPARTPTSSSTSPPIASRPSSSPSRVTR